MVKFRYLLIAGIILLDQIVKLAVRELMYVGESIPVIENVFHLTYVQNKGAAFSLFSGSGFMSHRTLKNAAMMSIVSTIEEKMNRNP